MGKSSSSTKQTLSHLLNANNDTPLSFSNSNASHSKIGNINSRKSCRQGDDFNVEEWISGMTQETDNKLSSQMLPTRAAAIKAKNGLTNQSGFGSYDKQKDKDPRAEINDNRIFYEEYIQPFKTIQLFNLANLEVLAYKLG